MDSIKRKYLESSLKMWEWIAEEASPYKGRTTLVYKGPYTYQHMLSSVSTEAQP